MRVFTATTPSLILGPHPFLMSERPRPTCSGQRGLGFRRGRTEERVQAMLGWPGWSCGWNPLGRGDHLSEAKFAAHLSWCRGAQSPHTPTRVWTPAGGRGTAHKQFTFLASSRLFVCLFVFLFFCLFVCLCIPSWIDLYLDKRHMSVRCWLCD